MFDWSGGMFTINFPVIQPSISESRASLGFYWMRSLCTWVSMLQLLLLCFPRPHPPKLSICNKSVIVSCLLMGFSVHPHFHVVIFGRWWRGLVILPSLTICRLVTLNQNSFETTVINLCSNLSPSFQCVPSVYSISIYFL